jgi:hypothetical protein
MASSSGTVDLAALDAMENVQITLALTQRQQNNDLQDQATLPSAKKRRMSKTHQQVAVKTEGNSHGEGGAVSELVRVKKEEEYGESVVADKICVGCQRYSTSTCWCDSTTAMLWALPNLRGAWCRECHNLWRLAFQDRSTLGMMSAHIQGGNQIAEEWSVSIIAWAMIRRNQYLNDRISKNILLERVDMVKWLISALGLPGGQSFSIRPLSTVDDLPSASTYISYMDNSGEVRVGVLAPALVGLPETTILRPADGTWFGTGRQTLICTNAEDKEWFEKMKGKDADSPSSQLLSEHIASVSTLALPPSPLRRMLSKEGKKLNTKLRGQVASALIVVQTFEGDDWKDLKETSFTQIVIKLVATQMEAADEQLEHLINEAESWCAGLGHCKMLTKRYRDCVRSARTTVRKFGHLDDALGKVLDFLKKHITVGHSF